ncbi:DUF6146 family protein [Flavobacterium franklandianum]|uniref:Lipoprotein n=1 Tax=Flavobacterium franklandianum TaxID=2594430 RepID=A0A553CNL1_9FLAO|nr:DUF6146 family protein [Flavobacterium franklandianum]TRX22126.1 hypothetical protein FNW17_05500 [Flavobacterium franklandianum]
MKNYFYIIALILFLFLSCNSKKTAAVNTERNLTVKNDTIQIAKNTVKVTNDTIRIANDELQYEVIIIDPGFSSWLVSRAFSRGHLSQSYMENKNQFYVTEWNNRVLQPQRYNPNLYEMSINYDQNTNYGYEVNYLIYNYMIYFQNTYKQNLYGFIPQR